MVAGPLMSSRRIGEKRMLDTLGLGECVPQQVTDAGSIGERILQVVDTPRQEQLDLSTASGPAEPETTVPGEPVQAGLFPDGRA